MQRKTLLESLSLGYNFGREREALSLVFINYFLIILFGVVVFMLHMLEGDLFPLTYRYHAIILFSILNLLLLRKRLINLARLLILLTLPILLLILPPLGGIHDDEFYFWFPYLPIGFSILAHFILHPIHHRTALLVTLAAYLFLGLFIDSYLMCLSDGSEQIIPFVIENHLYYRLIPFFLFLFVNGALSLLFLKNYQFRKIMDAQQEELVQAEKMSSLGILTSGLAHEINNPMNFISGSLNALNTLKEEYLKLDSESTPEKKKILERIDHVVDSAFEGVERATNLISKLKFFSNPGVKQKMLEVNLESIIQSVLRSIESKLPYNISLSTKIPGNLKVFCHEQQIRLVFTHIIRNAIDAFETKEDNQRESLEIIASRESINRHPFSKISFFNSGPTIPEDSLKHIFDPFFSSRDVGEGEGLGMALSYMIIKEHGGKMEVSNEDGKVRFDVFLPAWVEKIS